MPLSYFKRRFKRDENSEETLAEHIVRRTKGVDIILKDSRNRTAIIETNIYKAHKSMLVLYHPRVRLSPRYLKRNVLLSFLDIDHTTRQLARKGVSARIIDISQYITLQLTGKEVKNCNFRRAFRMNIESSHDISVSAGRSVSVTGVKDISACGICFACRLLVADELGAANKGDTMEIRLKIDGEEYNQQEHEGIRATIVRSKLLKKKGKVFKELGLRFDLDPRNMYDERLKDKLHKKITELQWEGIRREKKSF